VLTTTTANTEALHELESLICMYMEKYTSKIEGSLSVNEAVIDIQVPISSTVAIPLETKTLQHEPNIRVKDTLKFHDSKHGLDRTKSVETENVPKSDMPKETNTTKAGGDAEGSILSGHDTHALP
jgi:hypothetical protein